MKTRLVFEMGRNKESSTSRKYFGDLVAQDGRANLPGFENGKLNEE